MLVSPSSLSGIAATVAELTTAADDARWTREHSPRDAADRQDIQRDARRFRMLARRAARLLAELTDQGNEG